MSNHPVDRRAEDIAPAVLRTLGGLARFFSNRWVKAIVRAALYLTLGGLPAWLFALLDAVLSAWGPVLRPEVVADLKGFKAVLETYRRDAGPALAGEMPPRVWGESPFRSGVLPADIIRRTAAATRTQA